VVGGACSRPQKSYTEHLRINGRIVRLWGSKVLWFMCWFSHYINCLFVHMLIGEVWIYRLLFVCFLLRLRISPPTIKLAASNFAQRFIGVPGRESPICVNLADLFVFVKCHCACLLRSWFQENNFYPRLNCYLRNIWSFTAMNSFTNVCDTSV